MRLPRLALAAALAFAVSGAGASAGGDGLPGDLIRACLTELRSLSGAEGHSASHNFDLAKRCPDLAKRLAAAPEMTQSGVLEIHATSIEGLRDLQSFATGFQRKSPSAEKFSADYAGLDALLADVLILHETEDDIWARFLRWLERQLENQTSPGLKRFAEWLEGLDAPPWLGDVLLKVSIVLIVLLALIVVGNEIRLSGLLRRVRRKGKEETPTVAPASRPGPRATSLDELRGMPPRQMAAAVLEIVTAAFVERGWLSSSSSLTNGELVRQVGQTKRGLSGAFNGLVNGVEKIIYGDRLPDDAARQRLFDTAKQLVDGARADAPSTTVGRR